MNINEIGARERAQLVSFLDVLNLILKTLVKQLGIVVCDCIPSSGEAKTVGSPWALCPASLSELVTYPLGWEVIEGPLNLWPAHESLPIHSLRITAYGDARIGLKEIAV